MSHLQHSPGRLRGRRRPGYEQASEKARARWKGDAYRVQPYQYEDRNLVFAKHGPRRLNPTEQLRMMGFPSNYLEAKNKLSNDVKGQLLGNSFSAQWQSLACWLVWW